LGLVVHNERKVKAMSDILYPVSKRLICHVGMEGYFQEQRHEIRRRLFGIDRRDMDMFVDEAYEVALLAWENQLLCEAFRQRPDVLWNWLDLTGKPIDSPIELLTLVYILKGAVGECVRNVYEWRAMHYAVRERFAFDGVPSSEIRRIIIDVLGLESCLQEHDDEIRTAFFDQCLSLPVSGYIQAAEAGKRIASQVILIGSPDALKRGLEELHHPDTDAMSALAFCMFAFLLDRYEMGDEGLRRMLQVHISRELGLVCSL
jgi:hypothetical protein